MSTEVAGAPAAPAAQLAALRRIAIVPAYNEELNVGRVLGELRQFDPGLDVVVVSDGSTDRTADVAEAAGAHVIRLPFNLGIGGAVQTAFRYAWEEGYELAVRVDGDGQHDATQLGVVVAPVLAGEADIAVGSRFLGDRRLPLVGRAPRRHPRARVGRLHDRAPEGDRPDLGLPGAEPPRDRPLRRRPAARLPRGRGARDGDPAPRAADGGAGDDARARARPLVDLARSARSTTWSRSCSRCSSASSAAR